MATAAVTMVVTAIAMIATTGIGPAARLRTDDVARTAVTVGEPKARVALMTALADT